MTLEYHHFDVTQLEQIRQLEAFRPGAAATLVAMFETNTRDRLEAVRTASRSGDFEVLRSSAHSLKGIAASPGATGLAELAARVEVAALHADPSTLTFSGQLEGAIKATASGLARWLAET